MFSLLYLQLIMKGSQGRYQLNLIYSSGLYLAKVLKISKVTHVAGARHVISDLASVFLNLYLICSIKILESFNMRILS